MKAVASSLMAVLSLCLTTPVAHATDYLCREVAADWLWFSDHAAASIEYIIVGQPGRRFEVGTGMSILGAPRGWRSVSIGNTTVTAWGVGAIHIRRADDGPPFKVCVGAGKLNPIDIVKIEF